VNPEIRLDKKRFMRCFESEEMDKVLIEKLYQWLIQNSMKYTAGRYFRPGMIFSYLYC